MSTQTLERKPSWFIAMMTSTIGRKFLMAATGLFLVLFLTVHLIGNLQLLSNDGGESFNKYAHFMGTNPLIQTVSIGNFLFITLHIVYALILMNINNKARPQRYHYTKAAGSSTWASRSMMLLGSIILIFIVLHLANFWFHMKFGTVPTVDHGGYDYKNLYIMVQEAFTQEWLVAIYVLAMVGLAFHLSHGFQSAFQTFGINHVKYNGLIKFVGTAFSIIVPTAYAFIPIYMYVTQL